MKACKAAGVITAVLMASSVAVYAQRGGPPERNRGGAPDGGWGVSHQEMVPRLGPDTGRIGGPPQSRMHGRGVGRGRLAIEPGSDRMREAGATEQQIQILEAFMFEQRMKLIDLRAASEKAEMSMEHLLRGGSADDEAILQAVDALNQARGAVFKTDIESRLKIKQVLGEEILRKLRDQGPPNRPQRPSAAGGADHPGVPPRDDGLRPAPERSR